MGGSPTVLGNGNGNGKAGAAAAAAGTEPAKKEGGTESDPTQDRTPKPS